MTWAKCISTKPNKFMILSFFSVKPNVSYEYWDLTSLIMGGIHNFCSLMLFICYLLLKHPTLPDIKGTIKSIK